MVKKELTLEACNQRLTNGNADVRLELQGKRLYLRATLPHRSLPNHTKQYKLALGLALNPKNLEIAEARAWEVSSLKAQGRFDWVLWELKIKPKSDRTIGALIDGLHKHLQIGQPGKPNEETWVGQYLPAFKHFDKQAYLTEQSLSAALTATKPESRQRLHDLIALRRLAAYVGIPFDFAPYRSTYTAKSRKERVTPTDQEIVNIYEELLTNNVKSNRWRFVFALIATYGLRPHEAFFCTVSDHPPYTCTVSEGKTGARKIQPLFLEWAEAWQLWEMTLPQVPLRSHKVMGTLVCTMLSRRIAFPVYNLRHAYALRGIRFNIPDRIMALLMGHSVIEFQRTYSRWLKQSDALDAWQRANTNPHRPMPPT
ncbi:MAG: hypothetical protein RBJ76_13840 [Stenomitos frigidus ULC029]